MPSPFLAVALAAALTVGVAAPARAAEPPIGDCDRLVAHPEDPERVRAGVPFDEIGAEAAVQACEAALSAEPDNARYQFQYARALHKLDLLRESLLWYRKAAALDYPAAYFALGHIFAESDVMPRNQAKAANWFRKGAETGHAGAQYTFGLRLLAGLGVERDEAEALRWIRAAAAQGLARAQFMLGWMHDSGIVVEEDDAIAAAWYRRAAEAGHGRARMALAALGPAAELAPDIELPMADASGAARSAAPPSAPASPGQARDRAAAASREEPVEDRDDKEAVAAARAEPPPVVTSPPATVADALAAGVAAYRAGAYRVAFETWFPLAARGIPRAEFYVGGLFMEGRGIEVDRVQAYYWLTRAARQGHGGARELLSALTDTMGSDEIERAEELIATVRPGS